MSLAGKERLTAIWQAAITLYDAEPSGSADPADLIRRATPDATTEEQAAVTPWLTELIALKRRIAEIESHWRGQPDEPIPNSAGQLAHPIVDGPPIGARKDRQRRPRAWRDYHAPTRDDT